MPSQSLCCLEGGPGGNGTGGLRPVGEDEKRRPAEEKGLVQDLPFGLELGSLISGSGREGQ